MKSYLLFGALAFTLLILRLITAKVKHYPVVIIATGIWCILTVWDRITIHDGWKVITDEHAITKQLFLRNVTHLCMSGDSPFARAPLVDAVVIDGEGAGVDKILQGVLLTLIKLV